MKKFFLTCIAFASSQVWAVTPVPFKKAVTFTTQVTGSITTTLTVNGESTVSLVNNDGGGPESGSESVDLLPGKAYPMTMAGTVSSGSGAYVLSFTAPTGYAVYINNLPADYYESDPIGDVSNVDPINFSHPLTLEIRAVNASGGGAWGSFSGISVGQAISWQVGLGDLRTGRSAGGIQFREQDLSNSPSSRSRLYYTVPDNVGQITVIKDGSPAVNLRQIITPIGCTDLVDVSGGYEIRFYSWDQLSGYSDGLYTFGNAAWKTILVHSPATNELDITETEGTGVGAVVRISHFTETGASGGTVTTDGSYTIHTFNSSGTFTVNGGISTIDYLVVGGGGGGGNANSSDGGGGGGGSVEYLTSQSISNGAYSVVVGDGGVGSYSGANSSFYGTTAYGGGRGSGSGGVSPASGGSGGGGGANQAGAADGSGSNVHGGGTGDNGGRAWQGGGGGGAGAVGGGINFWPGTIDFNGGAGIANSISGTSTYYGAGGGGGTLNSYNPTYGGSSIGGGNTNGQSGSPGATNTGSGGGGGGGDNNSGTPYNGGNGGSGVVIIRYLTPSTGSIANARIWTLQEGDGSLTDSTDSGWKRTTTHTSTVPASGQRDDVVEIRTGGTDGTLVAKTKYHYVVKAWGEEVTQTIADPDGDALTTTYTYHEDSSDYGNYGQLRSVTDPTGNWIAYEYYDDLAKRGQLHYEYHPFKDSPSTVPSTLDPTSGRVIELDYDYDWTGRYRALVSRQVRINNVLTAETTRDQDFDHSTTSPRNRFTQNDYSDATHFTQTYVQNWREDAADADIVGQPCYLVTPNVTQTSTGVSRGTYNPSTKAFAVDDGGDHWRKLTVHGSYTSDETYGDTDEVSSYDGQTFDPVWLVQNKSTMDVLIRIGHGIVYRTETRVWTGSSFELMTSEDFTYDGYGHLTQRLASNGAMTTYTYTNGQMLSTTGPTGIETQFTYDTLGRIKTMVKKGVTVGSTTYPDITTTYTYDGANHVTNTAVSDGTLSQSSSATYDFSGRQTSSTTPGSYVTSYAYDLGPRTIKVILPDDGYKTTETYYDGQVKSITGDAVIPQYFDYSVGTGGDITNHVDTVSNPSDAYVETTTDWLGRKITETKPGWATSSTVTNTWTYDPYYGYLNKFEQPGKAATFYKYDTMGGLVYSWLDVSGSGVFDLSSTDRITKSAWEFFADSGNWWRRDTTSTYAGNSSTTETVTGKTEQQLSGLASGQFSFSKGYDVYGNVTTQSVDVVRGSKLVTTTTTTPITTDSDIVQIAYNGMVLESTDSTGLTMSYGYDGLARQTTSEDPRTGTTTTTYVSGTSQVYTVTDPESLVQATYAYDDSGRVKSVKNTLNKYVRYEYNKRGQTLHKWGEATYPIEYVYDDFGRIEYQKTYRSATGLDEDEWDHVTSGSADTTTFHYQDKTGFLSSKEDAANKEVVFTYTQAGQIKTRKLARNVITTYDYDDATGELLSQTYTSDPASTPTLTYTYNRLGQVHTVTDATGTRTFNYNTGSGGTLELQNEVLGTSGSDFYGDRLITYGYDTTTTGTLGRPDALQLGTSTSATAYQSVSYGYQADGRLDSITAGGQTFAYGYVSSSHLIATVTDTAASYTDTRSYNPQHDWYASRTTAIGSAPKAAFTYTPDNLGRAIRISKTGELFNGYGNGTQGLDTTYAYDDRSQLTDEQTLLGGTSTVLTGRDDCPGSGSHGYAYDQLGNRTAVTHNGNAATYALKPNGLNQYDTRTVPGVFDVAGAAPGSTVTVSRTGGGTDTAARHGDYFFDAYALANTAGAVFDTLHVADNSSPPQTGDLAAFLAKTPEAFTYDDDGNLTSDGRWDYAYDGENRLVSMQTHTALSPSPFANADARRLEFTYDYLGRRVEKLVRKGYNGSTYTGIETDQRYVYNGWNLLATLDATASGLPVSASYTWGLDLSGTTQGAGGVGGLLMIQDGGNTFLPAYDAMGNLHALMTVSSATIGGTACAAGAIVAAYEYDAFGQTLRASGAYAADNPFRFSTKYTDTETGLVYYGHRFYSPSLGRFINRDPSEEQGGLNLYSFCLNNAVNGYDLLGMLTQEQSAFMNLSADEQARQNLLYQTFSGNMGTDDPFNAQWDAFVAMSNRVATPAPYDSPYDSGLQLRADAAYKKFTEQPKAVQDAIVAQIYGDNSGTSSTKIAGSSPNASAPKTSPVSQSTNDPNIQMTPVCFTAGTPVVSGNGRERPIEKIRVGQRVKTEGNTSTQVSDTAIAPTRWRKVELVIAGCKEAGDFEMTTLMPYDRIHADGMKEGGYSQIDLDEMGIHGRALIKSISACPTIEQGVGRVVLTTYNRTSSDLMELRVAGLDDAIEVTSTHPLYSEDRGTWVSVGQLKIGENLRTVTGTVAVKSLHRIPERKRVYNLEVEGEHRYFVSKAQILAHNQCAPDNATDFSVLSGYSFGGTIFVPAGAYAIGGGFHGEVNFGVAYDYTDPLNSRLQLSFSGATLFGLGGAAYVGEGGYLSYTTESLNTGFTWNPVTIHTEVGGGFEGVISGSVDFNPSQISFTQGGFPIPNQIGGRANYGGAAYAGLGPAKGGVYTTPSLRDLFNYVPVKAAVLTVTTMIDILIDRNPPKSQDPYPHHH